MTKQEIFNYLVNSSIDQMTTFLIEDFHLDVASAMNIIYSSKTLELLQNKRTGLYEQSPAYVYHLLRQEYKSGQLPQVI
ncbi:MAG: hypothetical protein K6A82_06200 [Prevotella sp.]|nr:hypothetical protein [Prevotella sp.]